VSAAQAGLRVGVLVSGTGTNLQALLDAINQDMSLQQVWRCANVNAVDRAGMSDHGLLHIRIVANISLKLLRLPVGGGGEPRGDEGGVRQGGARGRR